MENRTIMTLGQLYSGSDGRTCSRPMRADAFTLVELLTVVFIISLLIGILIPSINSARTAAKKATTAKALDSIKVGMEMFKNDNGADFRQTNGYPPSFAHPPIPGYTFQSHLGEFPFLDPISDGRPPSVSGAHWLPAMLMGVDNLGYVKRSSVPNENDLRKKPWLWYSDDPFQDESYRKPERMPLYLDPGNTRTKATKDIPGRENREFFPRWDDVRQLPVIVDAFDQPVLYYVASTHGRTTNMVEEDHIADNAYDGRRPQEIGVPFYFHQDNEAFTGTSSDAEETVELGWDFGGRPREHAIGESGSMLTPAQLVDADHRNTFARYIVDRKIFESLRIDSADGAPLRPVNADSYLLITAGPDGRYGTADDVTNLPPWPD